MRYFKHFLNTLITTAVFAGFAGYATAQAPIVQAAPPIAVESAPLEPLATGPVVVELFSSQACMFCPQADAYLNTLAQRNNIIALSCHVDYFDVKQGSLAKPFCTQRQVEYSRSLRSGPKYTPQMVINGKFDAIGYKKDKVNAAIQKAAAKNIGAIKITPAKPGVFSLSMPAVTSGQYALWVAITNKPMERAIMIGKNKGQSVLYEHIVSDLISPMIWNGDVRSLNLSVTLPATKDGLAVFAQDQTSGEIVAAGQFKAAN